MSTPSIREPASQAPWRQTVPMDKLRPGKDNPREDPGDLKGLADTMVKEGLKQPILVVPVPGTDVYEIEDGWRRYLAAGYLQWTDIPAIIIPYQQAVNRSVRAIYTALITDTGKKSLNQIERGRGFARLQKEFGFSVAEIATQVGLSASTVSDDLMLLMLDDKAQKMIINKKVSASEMKAMLRTYRAQQRRKQGLKPLGPVWEAPWFGPDHALAHKAEPLCDSLDHSMRRRYGKKGNYRGACGQCWQRVIEQEYEKILKSAGWTPPP